jgi:hypothetical protein
MGSYKVTGPDGREFNVEADSIEDAHKGMLDHYQKEKNKDYQQDYDQAPWYKQPFMAAMDIGKSTTNALTAGTLDQGIKQLTGWDSPADTTARRARAGTAADVADIAAVGRYLPSAVPKVIKSIGGGPIARSITGALTAGGEGAAYGGIQAGTSGEDVTQGAGISGILGAVGQSAAGAANKGLKWIRGIDDTVPKYNITQIPKRNVTPMDRVNVAANESKAAGELGGDVAEQAAARKAFQELRDSKFKKSFNKEQMAQMDKIVQGDKGTNWPGNLSSLVSPLAMAGGIGVGAGFMGDSMATGILSGLAAGAGVKGMKKIGAQGTKEAVQDLRRMIYGVPKVHGPISPEERNKLGRMIREASPKLYEQVFGDTPVEED